MDVPDAPIVPIIHGDGIAPGANFDDNRCLAEPVHGSAPKYAGQDKVNPTAMILSGRILFEYIGWTDAAELILDAVESQLASRPTICTLPKSPSEFGHWLIPHRSTCLVA
jgi:isocitrate dehydrogenase